MRPELRKRILAYNKAAAAKAEKASDLDILVSEIMKLPYGQVKKLLTGEVLAVLEKYGYRHGEEESNVYTICESE